MTMTPMAAKVAANLNTVHKKLERLFILGRWSVLMSFNWTYVLWVFRGHSRTGY